MKCQAQLDFDSPVQRSISAAVLEELNFKCSLNPVRRDVQAAIRVREILKSDGLYPEAAQ